MSQYTKTSYFPYVIKRILRLYFFSTPVAITVRTHYPQVIFFSKKTNAAHKVKER